MNTHSKKPLDKIVTDFLNDDRFLELASETAVKLDEMCHNKPLIYKTEFMRRFTAIVYCTLSQQFREISDNKARWEFLRQEMERANEWVLDMVKKNDLDKQGKRSKLMDQKGDEK